MIFYLLVNNIRVHLIEGIKMNDSQVLEYVRSELDESRGLWNAAHDTIRVEDDFIYMWSRLSLQH